MDDRDFELVPENLEPGEKYENWIISVGPSDTTPRPPRPLLLKLGMEMLRQNREMEGLARRADAYDQEDCRNTAEYSGSTFDPVVK